MTHPEFVAARYGEAQRLAIGETVTGNFRLTLDGQTTQAIPVLSPDAMPAAVQQALEALPNVGAGNVLVLRDFGGDGTSQHQIRFRGDLGEQDVHALIVDTSGLSGTGAVTVEDNTYPADPAVLLSTVALGYNSYWNAKAAELAGAGHWADVGAFSDVLSAAALPDRKSVV